MNEVSDAVKLARVPEADRLSTDDDDSFDRRPQRRPPPPGTQLRHALLSVAESGMRNPEEEVKNIAKLVTDNYSDSYVRELFSTLTVSLYDNCSLRMLAMANNPIALPNNL